MAFSAADLQQMTRFASALLAASIGAACTSGERTAEGNATLHETGDDSAVVRPDGFARLIFGSDLASAERQLGDSLRPYYTPFEDFETCDYVYSRRHRGVAFMVRRDSVGGTVRVERVDIEEPGVLTVEGLGVGAAEARVREIYGSRVHAASGTLSPMPDARLLVVDGTDTTFRIVFEIESGTVSSYRAGRRPAVDMGEGCA